MADRAVILLALQLAGRAVAASPAALKLPMQPLLTGASIPALGFGTYTLDGDELKQALLHAIECGYRHIDTAAGYGNEAVVAEAVAECNKSLIAISYLDSPPPCQTQCYRRGEVLYGYTNICAAHLP